MIAVIMEDNTSIVDNYKVNNQPISLSSVIQRVPVICSLKRERKESNQHTADVPLTAVFSDLIKTLNQTNAHTSDTNVTFSEGMGSGGDRASATIVKDFPSPTIGVNFPDNQTHTDGFTLEFNLEFLESNFMSSVMEYEENVSEQSFSQTEEDILSKIVRQINKESTGDEGRDSKIDCSNIRIKTFKSGRKRGRKLGYRSENTKDGFVQCGVCGGQVRFIFQAK